MESKGQSKKIFRTKCLKCGKSFLFTKKDVKYGRYTPKDKDVYITICPQCKHYIYLPEWEDE